MRRLLLLAVLAGSLTLAPSSGAIVGGQPDGDEHPYVVFAGVRTPTGNLSCTATMVSPTLAITAAHCFPPGSQVLVFPYATGPFGGPPVTAEFIPHPDFCKPPACIGNPNDPAFFNTDDVAVLRLSQPVSLPRYAKLPKLEKSRGNGYVQKHVGKQVRLLGFGVQRFVPQPFSDFTRTIAYERLERPLPLVQQRFVQIQQDSAGFCLGDSGGPVLEKKNKHVVLAISSSNADLTTCLGTALAYRLDSPSAQSFLRTYLPSRGGDDDDDDDDDDRDDDD